MRRRGILSRLGHIGRRDQIVKQSGRFRLGFRQLQHRPDRRGPIGNTRFERHPPAAVLQQPRPGVLFRLLLHKGSRRARSGNQALYDRTRQGFIHDSFHGWLPVHNPVLRQALRALLDAAGNEISNQFPAQSQPGQHLDRLIRAREVLLQNSPHAEPRLDQTGHGRITQ